MTLTEQRGIFICIPLVVNVFLLLETKTSLTAILMGGLPHDFKCIAHRKQATIFWQKYKYSKE